MIFFQMHCCVLHQCKLKVHTLFILRHFNFKPSLKLRWCRAQDLYRSQIPVTTESSSQASNCNGVALEIY